MSVNQPAGLILVAMSERTLLEHPPYLRVRACEGSYGITQWSVTSPPYLRVRACEGGFDEIYEHYKNGPYLRVRACEGGPGAVSSRLSSLPQSFSLSSLPLTFYLYILGLPSDFRVQRYEKK